MTNEHQKELISKINAAANIINKEARTGGEYIVVSPDEAKQLKNNQLFDILKRFENDPILKAFKEKKLPENDAEVIAYVSKTYPELF